MSNLKYLSVDAMIKDIFDFLELNASQKKDIYNIWRKYQEIHKLEFLEAFKAGMKNERNKGLLYDLVLENDEADNELYLNHYLPEEIPVIKEPQPELVEILQKLETILKELKK